MSRISELIRVVGLAVVIATVSACGGGGGSGGGGSGGGGAPGNTNNAAAVTTVPVPGVPGGVPVSSSGTCSSSSDSNFNYNCPATAAAAAALNVSVAGSPPYSLTLPGTTVTSGTGNCSAGIDSNGTANFNGGSFGSDAIPFANAVVMDMSATAAFLQAASTAQDTISAYSSVIYIDRSDNGHMILFISGTVNGTQVVIAGDARFTGLSSSTVSGTFAGCLNTVSTPPTTPPTTLSCAAGFGSGTNGLHFYDPSGYTAYQLSTTQAGAAMNSQLTWGAQYQDPSLTPTSTTGSLQAELWAVSSSYAGGPISGYPLGIFTPNFTGSGAASPTTLYNTGYVTTTIVSNASVNNPPAGTYCVVATLNEYLGSGYGVVDWVQFGTPVTFQ